MITSKTPRALHPVYSNDNKFEFSEGGATFFDVTLSGAVNDVFRIFPDNLGTARLNIRYVLENYIYSQIAKPTASSIPNGIRSYVASVTSSTPTTKSLGTFKFYNGRQQVRELQQISDGDLINNVSHGVDVFPNDVLTIQKLNGLAFNIVDISPNGVVNDYVSNGVHVHVKKPDPRFQNYRFAYVNQFGGTDYVNFSKADRQKISIKKSTFVNDNTDVMYDMDVTNKFEVYSDYMDFEQSKVMEYFFTSPLVELIQDGKYYPVIIKNKEVGIIRKKEDKLITYKVEFVFAEQYNTQK